MILKRRAKVEPNFSMSSMSDVVFLMLIFFLCTSTLINPNALKLLLPKSTTQTSSKSGVSVSIKHYTQSDTYSYHIDGNMTPVNFDEIEGLVKQKLQNEENPTISLYVDKSVPVEQVVNVMNIAKRNDYKIILATSPE